MQSVQDQRKKGGLPEAVAHLYYKHGLFLSSYPVCAGCIVLVVVMLSCYPLLNIPLPGTIPTEVALPFNTATAENVDPDILASKNFSLIKNMLYLNNISIDAPFPWAQSKPSYYIQQIVMRTTVHPWKEVLELTDAFRAPLYSVFRLLETVSNHEDPKSQKTLNNICLHVGVAKKKDFSQKIFPEYNCLMLSPGNLWKQNDVAFKKDNNIINTIFQYHSFQKSKISIAELLFGVPLQGTGLKRYPLRARSRIIQYAITLILEQNDMEYLSSLRQKLIRKYPLYQENENVDSGNRKKNLQFVTYIYYPSEFRILEFLPLCIAFALLFFYVYFSMRKVEIVRSRFVLAISAVVTTLGSLMMSLGLCFFFGLTISSLSQGTFPYLVILVGLENCIVITKSVVSTDEEFDVKIRIAKALSNEGWSISKTLFTEITILTAGLVTFVPVIQEFCVFAIVGLISDFFIQIMFFSTILAVNIKRIRYEDEAKHLPRGMVKKSNLFEDFRMGYRRSGEKNHVYSYTRSRSFTKLQGLADDINTKIYDRPSIGSSNKDKKIPKRLKLVNFWARTRFFQRAFMIWMIVWIFSIVYNAGLFNDFINMTTAPSSSSSMDPVSLSSSGDSVTPHSVFEQTQEYKAVKVQKPAENVRDSHESTAKASPILKKLQFYDSEHRGQHLSEFHWAEVLKVYNISLNSKYVMVLPKIHLAQIITPEEAISLRHPQQKTLKNFQWKALAAALDPIDFYDDDDQDRGGKHHRGSGEVPLYPRSPMEIFLAMLLCTISVFVLTYTMVVFYRCICSRNYAEWRSSWNDSETIKSSERIIETAPVQVAGHKHRIECLVSDGSGGVVTSCLKGKINVWDSKTGEMVLSIQRNDELKRNIFSSKETNRSEKAKTSKYNPIWCLDYFDNIVAVGCANGDLEFWEVPSGNLKCIHSDGAKNGNGTTHIQLSGNRVIVARLGGNLEFYRLETFNKGRQIDWGFTSAYRRTHVRSGSTGSIKTDLFNKAEIANEEFRCINECTKKGHQQPINCLSLLNNFVMTGSQDHTVKVYNLDEFSSEFTLHGHCGPITSIFIDPWQHAIGGSASHDGLLCTWDLSTGACIYSIQAHDGVITSAICTPSYVISLGTDERLCVWEKFQGNLLNNINVTNAYSSLLLLTPSLLVTCKAGLLVVWDVRTGEPTHEVILDCANQQYCPKNMILTGNSVICDYGNEIRLVRFPMVIDKHE